MTALCAIPGCRIRGRHLPGCTGDDCGGCLPRATDEGLVCPACEKRAEERLAAIIGLAPDARLVAYGLVRHSTSGGSGKPGSSSPANDDALDVLHDVGNRLTTIARDIAETRGLTFGGDGRSRPLSASVAAQNGPLAPSPTLDPLES